MENIALQNHKCFSRSVRYGFYATLPLFLHYALVKSGSILANSTMDMILNAELILRKTVTLFGYLPDGFIPIFWISFVVILCLWEKKKMGPISPANEDFLKTMFEALPWVGVLLAAHYVILFTQPDSPAEFQSPFSYLSELLAMKSGAGFFEEFLCRLILLGGMLQIMKKCKVNYTISCIIGITLSSFVFAEMHYFHFFPELGQAYGVIENFNNPYSPFGFFFRFISGVILGWIYITRGFAVAAWSHAMYGYFSLIEFFA